MVGIRERSITGARWLLRALAAGVAVGCSSNSPADEAAPGTCPDGYAACGAQCLDLTTDAQNCGACGLSCAPGLQCTGGACQCQAGLTSCSGTCANLQGDGTNCGSCGTPCPGEQVCAAGVCSTNGCLDGQLRCGTSCVSATSDPLNCGSCGTTCASPMLCSGGSCACPAGTASCGGRCVITATDLDNCGACGTVCPGGASCSNGSCVGGTGGGPSTGGAGGTGGLGTGGGGTGGAGGTGGLGTGGGLATGGASGGDGTSGGTGGDTGGTGGDTGGTGGGGTSGGTGGDTGGTGGTIAACSTGTAQAGDVTLSVSSLQQKISGFGVSTAWAGDFRDPEHDPDTLWSTTTGAGLTLHRIRIGRGSTSETKIAQKAVEYGVKVWATPWEVSRDFIDRDQCPGTSSCDPPPKLIDPQGWADQLVDFVATMQAAGVPIYAISAENEPDSGGMNGTTSFTAAEMATWIADYLGPALAGTGTKLMAPETMNWWSFPEYFAAIQNDSAAWEQVSIFASHEYGRGPSAPEPAIVNAGKEYWQTEVNTGTTSDDPTGDNMPSALKLAEDIHNDLTRANLNAWHYWWLYAGGSSGLFDTNTNVWTKRFWIMGNFSRFVRPGYLRVSTAGTAPEGVLLSAYTNLVDGAVVVVAINKNTTATPVSLFVSDSAPCTVTPWVTSATDSLVAKTPIPVTGARFTASLEARSVTSFVGTP